MICAAVDLYHGRCVQLTGGKPGTERFVRDDPVAVAIGWAKAGADALHLVDLNAALGDGNNAEIVGEILRRVEIPVQVGGGIRTTADVMRNLASGAVRVIIGTRGVTDPDWLGRIVERYPGKVMLALDVRGDEIVIEGWKQGSGEPLIEFAQVADGLKLAAFLYTDVEVEGRSQGIRVGPIRDLIGAVRLPVIVAGGIRSAADLNTLAGLGAGGAVIGTALYGGELTVARAQEAFYGEG
ncbi:MAG: HisA/HisF-related TIM barrel protein [Candidatus Bipolaricaulia bacterium]